MRIDELYTEFEGALYDLFRKAVTDGLDPHEHVLHAVRVFEDRVVAGAFEWISGDPAKAEDDDAPNDGTEFSADQPIL